MGAIFSQPVARGEVDALPVPRGALVAQGGEGPEGLDGAASVCLGAEREGLPGDLAAACERRVTIPLRAGAESLNVAAAARSATHVVGRPMPSGSTDCERGAASRPPRHRRFEGCGSATSAAIELTRSCGDR
jgi:tRNA C32,U32 (ribose-2'-O)-methylase TrmJ